MGDEADEEGEGKDNAKTALYDSEGETRPKKNRTFNTVELDRHGNRVFDGQQEKAAPEKESPKPHTTDRRRCTSHRSTRPSSTRPRSGSASRGR